MHNSQELANIIKKTAKSKNIAVGKMLADCGLSINTLSSMQSGGYYPRLEAIAKIADYLDCSVDYLLGRTDCPEVARSSQPDTPSSLHIAAKGRGAHVIDMDPEQLKALKKALADLPDDV